jgi:3-oxoacyl-[acyl-carrier protein] reductase
MWAPILEYTESAWEAVINLNLKGSFFGAQAAAQQMISQGGGGRIVFSSSVAGIQAIPYLSAYGVTKAGLRHMARSLALELGPHHIRSASTRSASAPPSISATWTTTQTTKPIGPA